ncbi:DedA family protein/thiosulfate sulfurtransferase GlpE [Pigmentiphaga soli]|uniref:DedA family protein/thiosulfate sulfurtransferase GlpE n=1 Tax=Pigmentiphaga soli TaxID=1007095 RepID=A0ABP8GWK7_9BURK
MNVLDLLAHGGIPLVFLVVLAQQSGLPVPVSPVLVGGGALAALGWLSPVELWLAAIVASQLADHGWFLLGRRYGHKLLGLVCRLSLSAESCVVSADGLALRHGPAILAFAKFIPGVSALAVPAAAARGLPYGRFALFSAIGAALWSGTYILIGAVFSRQIESTLDAVSRIGGWTVAIVAVLAAAYLVWALAMRWRLVRLHRLVRISPEELETMMAGDDPHLIIVDARSPLARERDPREFPHSVVLYGRPPASVLPPPADGHTIVTFCTCPNEASAALVAKRLIKAGYRRVRVLTGGVQALERLAAGAAPGDAVEAVEIIDPPGSFA